MKTSKTTKLHNYPKIIPQVIILLALMFSIVVLISITNPILTQEKNTVKVLYGISNLNFTDNDIVKYDEDEIYIYYISSSQRGSENIEKLLSDEGYIFSEQFGAAYVFENRTDSSKKLTILSRMFTRNYILWKCPIDL